MAMNFAPLDCSFQGASSEPKKIYLDFPVSEKLAKNQKIHIFGSHTNKSGQKMEFNTSYTITHRSMAGTFTIPEFNSSCSITDCNLVRIGDKKFFEKNHVPPPSI
jgi:hypothetical protein